MQYNSLASTPGAKQIWLKNSKWVKDNPALAEKLDEEFEGQQSIEDIVFGLKSLPPTIRGLKAREARNNPFMTAELLPLTTEAIEGAEDELTFSPEEFKNTQSYMDYAATLEALKAHQKNAPGVPNEAYSKRQDELVDMLVTQQERGLKEHRAAKGFYPTMSEITFEDPRDLAYNNVEDIRDDELDSLLTDFSTPFLDRYPYTPPEGDTAVEVQVAGKTMPKSEALDVESDIQKLKQSKVYNRLKGKTQTQKKQMIDRVLGRDISEDEIAKIISKLGVETLVIDPLKSLIPQTRKRQYPI